MNDKLKPCPFCGGEAKRFTIGDEEPTNAGGDVIACVGMCGASSHVEFGRKENLVSLWNDRAEDSHHAELVEALNSALEMVLEATQSGNFSSEEFNRCNTLLAKIGGDA